MDDSNVTDRFASKKVIVTGGAGFIGSNLVKRLVEFGADVVVIDNLWRGSYDNLRNEQGAYVINMGTNFRLADLTDYGNCLEFIRDADYVFHLADIVGGINFVFANEEFVFRQNLLINTNTITACLKNGIGNCIYVGTACSYPKHLQMEDSIVTLREDQVYPAEPESAYGWSKLMGEYEAELAGRSNRMNVGILRFHNVYGPGSVFDQERSQVIPSLVRKANNYPNEDFIVWGSGDQYRDFIYVDDVIDALMLVASKGMGKGPIQIGSEIATSVRRVAEIIVEISGKKIEPVFDVNAPQGDRGRVANCDRAREILGWYPRTELKDGIAKLYAWVQNRMQQEVRL
jgi:nucleoside-diphosphate-sugar epimerase